MRLPYVISCPVCKLELAGAIPAAGENENLKPKPGSIAVCMRCGSFLVFAGTNEELSLREMTEDEIVALSDGDRNLMLRGRRKARKISEEVEGLGWASSFQSKEHEGGQA